MVMKKRNFVTLVLVLLFALVFGATAVACEEEKRSEEITVVSISVEQTDTYVYGDADIDLSAVKIKVTYSNKTTSEISLTDEMLSTADRLKFSEKGTHTVEISYMGKICYYQFEVVESKTQNKYLAQFHSMGGSEVNNLTVSSVTAFPMPERKGYTFDGWYAEISVSDSDGRVSYIGNKAVEPYVLTKNTDFYAKWIDDRTYEVTFYDGYEAINVVTVHHGESIDVNAYEYPEDRVQSGKTFTGWNVINGDTSEVTGNLTVRANFAVDKCIVRIEYANSGGVIEKVEHDYDYGTEITVGEGTNYRLPLQEGYTSRFVVYYDHGEDYEDQFGEVLYDELPEDRTVTLTHAFTTIKAKFTILTYKIIIYNGRESQTETALKSGELALERTYENQAAQRDFTVDWNTGFRFSDHTQEPNIATPATIKDANGVVGYKGEWAFAVNYGLATEELYNASGMRWNEEEQIYEPVEREEGETDNNWILTDSDGKYVARVVDKELTAIRGDVTVCAIYTKRTFDVTLIRKDNGQQITLTTFKVKYLSDINIYDALAYPNDPGTDGTTTTLFPAKDVTGYTINDAALRNKAINVYDPNAEDVLLKAVKVYNEYHPDDVLGEDETSLAALSAEKKAYAIRLYIEKLYLKENTDLSVKRQADGYYVTSEVTNDNAVEEDWIVEWFTDASWNSGKVDFAEGETVNVGDKITLYCKDTDRRRFEVLFYYDYNFNTGRYNRSAVPPVADKFYYAAEETVVPPSDNKSVTKTVSGSTVTMQYSFTGWYDTPYSLYLSTGYRGRPLTDFSKRTASTYYFAHYECTKTVNVVIYDKTQSTAFIGVEGDNEKGFAYEDCAVADNTINYTMPVGTRFDMSILYKGKSDGAGRAISGQSYYDNYKMNTFVLNNYDDGLGAYLATRFGGTTVAERIGIINALSNVLQALIGDYKNVLNKTYAHDYSGYTTGDNSEFEYYLSVFGNASCADKISDFVTEYNELSSRGTTIKGVLDGAGYTAELMSKLGDVDDFLTYYAKFLYALYNTGYEPKHTGFYAVNISNTNGLTVSASVDLAEECSTYEKLLTVCAALAEYAEFLEEFNGYSDAEVTPKYEDSQADLNKAYGYDGVGEIKYSFSGWYEKANYTNQITTNFTFDAFTLENDRVMYAKWTDITKGPEGLVYEQVTVTTAEGSFQGYVLADYTNADEFHAAGYDGSEYYNVTTNDNGDIPGVVATVGTEIEMLIPATIDKYDDKTTEAAAQREYWSGTGGAYKQFFVKEGNTFVQASSVFDESETYYKKTALPVVGIKSGALVRYGKYVTDITIPLNLYFVEEGAFRGCNAKTVSRTQPKSGETEYDYVVLDANRYAIYQDNAAPYLSVTGNASGTGYAFDGSKTLLAYVTNYDQLTEFALPAGTKTIGAYAFANAVYLTKITGTESVTEIHESAFNGASSLTSFGEDGKIVIGSGITRIEENAFTGCTKATDVTVENGSSLTFVGKDAFLLSGWYESTTLHEDVVSLLWKDGGNNDVGIILGYKAFHEGDGATRYNANGGIDVNGEYYGKVSDQTLILSNGSGVIYHVIVPFAVRYICEGAFTNYNARKYTFRKGVGAIGDKAFAGQPSLSDIVIDEAFGGTQTILGDKLFYEGGQTVINVSFPSESVKNTVVDGSWDAYQTVFNYLY